MRTRRPAVSCRAARLAGLLLAGLPLAAAGQDSLASAGAPCDRDPSARPDTAAFTLFLGPPHQRADGSQLADYMPFVSAMASAFKTPERVVMETWPGTFYKRQQREELDTVTAVGPLTGRVQFRLRNGRVRDVAWELLPDSRDVTREIQAAIYRADSALDFVGLRVPGNERDGRVRLGVSLTDSRPTDQHVPLLRLRMPYLEVEYPVEVIHIPRPTYPPAAARRRVDGNVVLQFVVDENGKAQRPTIRVVEANYIDFVEAASDAIVAARFRPARVGSCPVNLTVQQRIRFKISK